MPLGTGHNTIEYRKRRILPSDTSHVPGVSILKIFSILMAMFLELLWITLIVFHSLVTTHVPSFAGNEVTVMYMERLKAKTSAAKGFSSSISGGELHFIRGLTPRKGHSL